MTPFLVTGLAQWAGPRTGAGVGSGGYRVRFRARPRVISYLMFVICVEHFGTYLGHLFGDFSDNFRILF
jgi:hypothetical protein